MSDNDVFAQLTNRKRPSVPPRDNSVLSIPEPLIITEESLPRAIQTQKGLEETEPSPSQEMPETVKTVIRIEKPIDDGIRALCAAEKITKETLLEASFLLMMKNQEMKEEIVALAKLHIKRRKRSWLIKTTEAWQRKAEALSENG
jgi:hypothetical protein